MKKILLMLTVCFAAGNMYAQTSKKTPPPPPPPPIPPVVEVTKVAPPPPPPPKPPKPVKFRAPKNSMNTQMEIRDIEGGDQMITVTKNGKTEKIKMSAWNANKAFYEKKYGELPPPPPPPPALPATEVIEVVQ